MSSRTQSPAVDVRQAALEAALQLFAAQGFGATSVQEVASAVGVTKQAVLHHFPSKELLRDAVLASLVEHWREVLPRLLLAASASEDRFDAVFGELHRFFNEQPDRARLVLREAIDRPEETKRLLKGAMRAWMEALAAYIRSGQGGARHWEDVDPEAYLVQVLNLVISAAASAEVLSSTLGRDGRGRYHRELRRIAKASLFVPRTPKRQRPTKR